MDGLLPVYIRITINGQRIDQSIQRYVQACQWSVQAVRIKENGNEDPSVQWNDSTNADWGISYYDSMEIEKMMLGHKRSVSGQKQTANKAVPGLRLNARG